ncbi:preprotein translocase subunit YajC [Chryseobacterium sp. SC28]|uniref:preprotein translocase subunit YajC n=1 Tax=Chryseobacterium sp. SC28 TaxID=2268028 RepID=UPI000F64F38E|nr:preprotein translocase subunit YajC [Chryseobacterium sp. SC28]RRQ45620.1 preprotein translocase subunit YajC [Chryseobacterium sp. SC28]
MLTIFLQAAAPAQQSMTPTLIMIGLMVVGFYFLMIRPQMKKQKQEKNFQESLKPGAKVVTTSGMHGTIFSINDDGVILETLSGKLKFEKAAISRDFTAARFPETFGETKK